MLKEVFRHLDSGLVGIIEKLIAISSNAFLTGVPNECSKSSSFTKQIVDSRLRIIDGRGGMDGDYSKYIEDDEDQRESLKELKGKVLNLVEYWTI
ncbi:hypothetical protein BY996DRAFT_7436379 [Phakopsora pachyrhizi]|nr:hypothetical protein BY996DRAFT_7436379 [Phakopsora pachyrhizi]